MKFVKIVFKFCLIAMFLFSLSCKNNQTDTNQSNKSNQSNQSNQIEKSLVQKINGAGATFPYPLYAKLFNEYFKSFKTEVNYQPIGSGGGIRQLKSNTVVFGATDTFIKDEELVHFSGEVLHIPTCAGAVGITFNIPNVKELYLNSDLIVGIFLGDIKKWNDKKIKELNPNTELPELSIIPVQRSDSSGTTYIFADFLSKTSEVWKLEKGVGKTIDWPMGLSGKGNAGVANLINQIPGTIGYLGSVYAIQNKMSLAHVQNKSGNFIYPTLDSISIAAEMLIPDDTRVSIANTNAVNGYPIAGLTWLIVYKNQKYANRTLKDYNEVKKLLNWIIIDGQQYTRNLNFAPLSDTLVKKSLAVVDSLTFE